MKADVLETMREEMVKSMRPVVTAEPTVTAAKQHCDMLIAEVENNGESIVTNLLNTMAVQDLKRLHAAVGATNLAFKYKVLRSIVMAQDTAALKTLKECVDLTDEHLSNVMKYIVIAEFGSEVGASVQWASMNARILNVIGAKERVAGAQAAAAPGA